MEIKYKLGMFFWTIFPWIIILLGVGFIVLFIFSISFVGNYIDQHGIKSIVQRLWEGKP